MLRGSLHFLKQEAQLLLMSKPWTCKLRFQVVSVGKNKVMIEEMTETDKNDSEVLEQQRRTGK